MNQQNDFSDEPEVDPELEGLLSKAYRIFQLSEMSLKQKTQPNEKCHCGSGKKAKKCCRNPVVMDRLNSFMRNVVPALDGRIRTPSPQKVAMLTGIPAFLYRRS